MGVGTGGCTANAAESGSAAAVSDRKELLFFSSRRRHTRCSRDWSSDVCSSDLLDSERYSAPKLTPRPSCAVGSFTPILPRSPVMAPSTTLSVVPPFDSPGMEMYWTAPGLTPPPISEKIFHGTQPGAWMTPPVFALHTICPDELVTACKAYAMRALDTSLLYCSEYRVVPHKA